MTARWESLPAALQGRAVPAKRGKRLPGRGTWRCHECGEVTHSWAAAERHSDATRHGRIEVVLEPGPAA